MTAVAEFWVFSIRSFCTQTRSLDVRFFIQRPHLSSLKKQADEFAELIPILWEYLFPAGYVCTGIPMIQKIL